MNRVRSGGQGIKLSFDIRRLAPMILACITLVGSFVPLSEALAARTTVVSFRHFSTQGYTRVVFVLNRKTLGFRTVKLKNPPRVVLEIPSGRLKSNFRLPSFGKTSLARKVSVGRSSGEKMKIVIRLAHARIRHNVFSLSKPHRIVIDLRETTSRKRQSSKSLAQSGSLSNLGNSSRRDKEPKKPPKRRKVESRESQDITTRFLKGRGRVVLDPGHGGRDPGTTGLYGLVEKHLVLNIAHRIAATLRKRLPRGNKIFLTRTRDTGIALEKRTSFANGHKADVFVSIHVNSSPQKYTRGVETYLLSEASTPRALELAAKESGTTVSKLSDLQKILNDLMLRSKVDESLQLAENVQGAMIARLQRNYSGVKDLGVKRGPFYVLLGASMASILTEIAFVTNPREAWRLRTSKYRQALADGIAEGIAKFVGVPLRRKQTSSGQMEARSPEKATR